MSRQSYEVIMDRAIKDAQDKVERLKAMKAKGQRSAVLENFYDDSPFIKESNEP